MPIFYKQFVFGTIFDVHDFQKGTLWTTFSVKMLLLLFLPSSVRRPRADPVFHETIVITVPLGHRVFFSICFDGDWIIVCSCCVSLCYILYNICYHFVSQNIGKRQAVEPSDF